MQQEVLDPNMEAICRLCLKENTGTVRIFNDYHQDNTQNHAIMSIPMRIMACVALEVQTNDGLPKQICTECRYQLEKSYLFRKQSQASDSKLRKHIRLLSLGKSSKVFRKNSNEDDDDDELEFYDSVGFIKQYDDRIKMAEQSNLESKLKAKLQSDFEKYKDNLKTKCKQELRAEVEQGIKNEIRQQIEQELEKERLPKIKQECLQQAKKLLRDEIKDECRQTEMKNMLDDLQSYLKEKQLSRLDPLASKVVITQKIRPLSPTNTSGDPLAKISCYTESSNNADAMIAGTKNKDKYHVNQTQMPIVIKPELILSDNQSDMETNVNDDDVDSDNFLIYDTDEGFEIQKKSEGGGALEDDTFVEDHIQAYESSEEQMGINNSQEGEKISTISYRIEDTENGEITFSKKSVENLTHHHNVIDDDNNEALKDANMMIINYPNEIDEEEHLDMIDYNDEDGRNKVVKPIILKGQPLKRYRSKESNNTGNISLTADNYTTTSTVETTHMTKTFVNTVQRFTDTPKIFKCNDCPMVFSTKQSLERHLRTHRKVEATGVTFQCPECQIVVSCSSALRRHMFIHCDEKPFTCIECGKSFVQKEILKRHMQTHTGIKPHKCPHCDRAFAQRINLQQHINRHHMEEPRIQQHSCHLCPKRFNHASGLSRHLASHSGVAFQCSECDRTFGDRSSIKRHIANKHGNGKIAKSDKHLESN